MQCRGHGQLSCSFVAPSNFSHAHILSCDVRIGHVTVCVIDGKGVGGVLCIFCSAVQSQPEQPAMDLLGSILGSMDKPPSASEKERKLAKGSAIEK